MGSPDQLTIDAKLAKLKSGQRLEFAVPASDQSGPLVEQERTIPATSLENMDAINDALD